MQDQEIAEYLRVYPLSNGWQDASVIRHITRVGTAEIHLVGLSCTNSAGRSVTGSAGQPTGSPFGRAYFELLERTALVDAQAENDALLDLFDQSGRWIERVSGGEVFLQSPDEQNWRYAQSNGVAAGADWPSAARRAELELVERDRVLRSWYGEGTPRRIPMPHDLLPKSLGEHYDLEAHSFDEPVGDSANAEVVSVFGFPRHGAAPLIFGFGARETLAGALDVAAGECLQRLGFLWGEAIPDAPPPFAPMPDYHQEYFLYPPHHARVRTWLQGAHRQYSGVLSCKVDSKGTRRFADLTPAVLRSKMFVVKALPLREVPLTFGRGHPRFSIAPPECLAIHPIA